jgi:four helix bundle protein
VALRESKKDYLHFLYIARGSLAETQYFVHLARRRNYLAEEQADALARQTSASFAYLHGLIQAVEKEAGKLSTIIAATTSLIVDWPDSLVW